jgi:monovalent cation:H+ antiporter-2, CPA2 family
VEASSEILQLGAILLAAAAAGWLARLLALPAVLGFLAVGVVVSPFTPGYVASREYLELLAEFGVVLLLFEVGIEINLGHIRHEQRALLVAVPAQVVITTALTAGILALAGVLFTTALVLGLAVALSSSVVIVNIVRSRKRRTDRATESAMLTWSVLQDICGVLLAAVLLSVAGVSDRPPALAVAGLVGFLGVSAAAAWLLPRALRRLGSEPDLFLIVSIGLGLGLAGLGAAVFGLPAALAAFIAGLAVAESPESVTARRQMVPFRDVFAVLFFVSVGTLINPQAVLSGLPWLGLIVLALVVGKILVTAVAARLAKVGRPLQLAVGTGQVGELSFVLTSLLVAAGLLASEIYAAMLTAVVISIAFSTVVVRLHWTRTTAVPADR